MNSNLRNFVFFVMLLGLAYAAFAWMVKPANEAIAQQRQQINTKIQKLNQLSVATAEVENLTCELSRLTEAIEFFETRLPHESQIHKVLEMITVIAQKKGLRIGTISTLKPKDKSGYIEQPLKMGLTGDFYSFYSFLIEAEKLPRIIRLRQLKIKKADKNSSRITADFVLSVFFST